MSVSIFASGGFHANGLARGDEERDREFGADFHFGCFPGCVEAATNGRGGFVDFQRHVSWQDDVGEFALKV